MLKEIKLLLDLRKDMKNSQNHLSEFNAIIIDAGHYKPIEKYLKKLLPFKLIYTLKSFTLEYFDGNIVNDSYLILFNNLNDMYGFDRDLELHREATEEFQKFCYIHNMNISDFINDLNYEESYNEFYNR